MNTNNTQEDWTPEERVLIVLMQLEEDIKVNSVLMQILNSINKNLYDFIKIAQPRVFANYQLYGELKFRPGDIKKILEQMVSKIMYDPKYQALLTENITTY